METRFMSH